MAEPFSESWFYAPGLDKPGDRYALPDDEAHHLRKVLRIRVGETVIASNGRGAVFTCRTAENRGGIELEAENAFFPPAKPYTVTMVLSLLKGRDLEEPVEALVQLEVARISIVLTDHTQEFKGQDHSSLVKRLRAKSVTGLKQAKKPWLTEIDEPVDLQTWRMRNPGLNMVVLDLGEDRLPQSKEDGMAILCGPEGGFSQRELEWMKGEGAYAMGLGPTRIRAIHAPIISIGKLMGTGFT